MSTFDMCTDPHIYSISIRLRIHTRRITHVCKRTFLIAISIEGGHLRWGIKWEHWRRNLRITYANLTWNRDLINQIEHIFCMFMRPDFIGIFCCKLSKLTVCRCASIAMQFPLASRIRSVNRSPFITTRLHPAIWLNLGKAHTVSNKKCQIVHWCSP